ARGRDRRRRLLAARSSPHRRRARRFPAQFPRLRPRRQALPDAGLQWHHQAHGPDRPVDVFLPGVPALADVGDAGGAVKFSNYVSTTLLTTYCVYARAIPSLAHRGASSGDILKAERGVASCGRRLVTVRPGRPGTPPARHYDLAARSSL